MALRLWLPGVVTYAGRTNPLDTARYRCGLRLAKEPNSLLHKHRLTCSTTLAPMKLILKWVLSAAALLLFALRTAEAVAPGTTGT